MVNVNELKAEYIRKGYTKDEFAKAVNITPRTLSNRFKKRIFGSDEIERICEVLEINSSEKRERIFFAKMVT